MPPTRREFSETERPRSLTGENKVDARLIQNILHRQLVASGFLVMSYIGVIPGRMERSNQPWRVLPTEAFQVRQEPLVLIAVLVECHVGCQLYDMGT